MLTESCNPGDIRSWVTFTDPYTWWKRACRRNIFSMKMSNIRKNNIPKICINTWGIELLGNPLPHELFLGVVLTFHVKFILKKNHNEICYCMLYFRVVMIFQSVLRNVAINSYRTVSKSGVERAVSLLVWGTTHVCHLSFLFSVVSCVVSWDWSSLLKYLKILTSCRGWGLSKIHPWLSTPLDKLKSPPPLVLSHLVSPQSVSVRDAGKL